MQTNNSVYPSTGFIDSECSDRNYKTREWRLSVAGISEANGAIQSIHVIRGSRYRDECVQIRDDIKDYLNSESGCVSWQESYVGRTYRM